LHFIGACSAWACRWWWARWRCRPTRRAYRCWQGCSRWWVCPCVAACHSLLSVVALLSLNCFLLGVLTSPMLSGVARWLAATALISSQAPCVLLFSYICVYYLLCSVLVSAFFSTYLMLKEVLCSYTHLKSQQLILRSNGYCFFHVSPSHSCTIFLLTLVLAIGSKIDACDFKCTYEHNRSGAHDA
jgi:hypothetical protein